MPKLGSCHVVKPQLTEAAGRGLPLTPETMLCWRLVGKWITDLGKNVTMILPDYASGFEHATAGA